jgi:uncharacterized membrane protein
LGTKSSSRIRPDDAPRSDRRGRGPACRAIVYNVGAQHPFDRFPFGLLTLIVSLEAIFLSTFVLISQNEGAKRDDERERNDHLTDLWSEAWSELIGEKLGIDPADVRKRYERRMKESDQHSPG